VSQPNLYRYRHLRPAIILRGRYSEATLESARNAILMSGLALLVGLYYVTESLPLMLLALVGWGAGFPQTPNRAGSRDICITFLLAS
jgi:hypothetical protein